MFFEQETLKLIEYLFSRQPISVQAQFFRNRLDKLSFFHYGVEDEGCVVNITIKRRQENPGDCRLAEPHIPVNQGKTLFLAQKKLKVRKGFPVCLGFKIEMRIGGQSEGLLGEPEVLQIRNVHDFNMTLIAFFYNKLLI